MFIFNNRKSTNLSPKICSHFVEIRNSNLYYLSGSEVVSGRLNYDSYERKTE